MRAVVVAALLVLTLSGCFGPDDPSEVADPIVRPSETRAPPVPPPVPDPGPVWPHFPNNGTSELTMLELEAADGHLIPVSVYRPVIANATQQVPVLLHSHGFGGARATDPDKFQAYVAAGFGVVSLDQRGHGDARDDSVVGFMQPDVEVADAQRVIDEIATWDWVLQDGPSDPRLGGIGYSYSGALQLMLAIFEPRIDAIVPEITWSNITEGLAPNGAIKSAWVHAYYASGNAQGTSRFSDDFHRGWAWALAANELPAGQAGQVPDLVSVFNRASPDAYASRTPAPALFVQGMADTLFPLNHAIQNMAMFAAAGAEVALNTHNQGHMLNTQNYAAASPLNAGAQGTTGARPCGEREDLDIRWHQRHLLGLDVQVGPRVCIALEDDTAIVGNTWPLPWTQTLAVDFPGPYPVAQLPAGYTLPLEAFDPDQEAVVAGIPRLTGTITSPGPDAILYFSLQIVRQGGVLDHIVDDQVVPLRIKGPNTGAVHFDIELGGVGTRVGQDDIVFLVMSTVEPIYVGGQSRVPGGLVVEDLHLELPVVQYPIPLA